MSAQLHSKSEPHWSLSRNKSAEPNEWRRGGAGGVEEILLPEHSRIYVQFLALQVG